MAEEALLKLEGQLQCAVCLDTYSNPKQLLCNHVYCQGCLDKLLERDQQEQLSLACPACRQVTPISERGARALQPAFHINNLLEIYKSLLQVKYAPPLSSIPDGSSAKNAGSYCSEHHDEELKLYCKSCEELICLKCVIEGAQHQNHCYEMPSKVYNQYKGEIIMSLEPLEKQLSTINASLAQIETHCEEIFTQQEVVEADIHTSTKRLHEIIDTRKTELISHLQHITQRKLQGLSNQKDKLKTSQEQLTQCLATIKQSIEQQKVDEVLRLKNNLIKQVKELIAGFQPEALKPYTEADVIFFDSWLSDITAMVAKYGQVIETETCPVPLKCYATGTVQASAALGERVTTTVQSINSFGEPCVMPSKSLECELWSEISGRITKCDKKQIRETECEISFRPVIKGNSQLHIKVEGQHIRESPFHLSIASSFSTLGSPILSISGVSHPWAVAINHEGNVIVTESNKHCVSLFSSSGKRLMSFGNRGSEEGQFNYPRGVTVDGDENILVADSHNHRIQKFTSDGVFLAAVGKKVARMHLYIPGPWASQSTPLLFSNPKAITFNAHNGKLYVSDEDHRIQILNSDLSFHGSFKYGKTIGMLYDCSGSLTCDSMGNVYIADGRMAVIQVYTPEGEFLRSFGGEKWKLTFPVSIAIDSNDLLYIGEHLRHRICVFTPEGNILKSFNEIGEDPENCVDTRGLAADKLGVVYVCDHDNDLVSIF